MTAMRAVDPEIAHGYERYLVPAFFERWAADLVGQARLRGGDHVLDVACGTGVVARLAAGVDETIRVTGVDHDPAYLEVARRVSAGLPVTWCQADAANMPFADATFEVVLCQQGLQFFADARACLSEMRRVLADGGRLLASVWASIDQSPGFAALAAALDKRMGPEAAAALTRGPFSMPDARELKDLARTCDFDEVSVVARSRPTRFPSVEQFVCRFLRAYPIAPVNEGGEKAVTVLVEDARRLLDGAGVPGEFTFTMKCNVLSAKATVIKGVA